MKLRFLRDVNQRKNTHTRRMVRKTKTIYLCNPLLGFCGILANKKRRFIWNSVLHFFSIHLFILKKVL